MMRAHMRAWVGATVHTGGSSRYSSAILTRSMDPVSELHTSAGSDCSCCCGGGGWPCVGGGYDGRCCAALP